MLKIWERPAPKERLLWRMDSLFDLVKPENTPAKITRKKLNLRLRTVNDSRPASALTQAPDTV